MTQEITPRYTVFLRSTPDGMHGNPSLISSLQSFETMLILIGQLRYPHALVISMVAIESALRTYLKVPPADEVRIRKLCKAARRQVPALGEIADKCDLEGCIDARNEIVHSGYVPLHQDVAARWLMGTAIPYLKACARHFFNYDLTTALLEDFGKHLKQADRIYQVVRKDPALPARSSLYTLAFFIRYELARAVSPDPEYFSYISKARFDDIAAPRNILHDKYNAWHDFGCPVCGEPECLVCELGSFDEPGEIEIAHGHCLNCGYAIPAAWKHVAHEVLGTELDNQRNAIFEKFGPG